MHTLYPHKQIHNHTYLHPQLFIDTHIDLHPQRHTRRERERERERERIRASDPEAITVTKETPTTATKETHHCDKRDPLMQ